MSAETRWKLPDWHQRPVRWKVFVPRFTPDEWKPLDLKPHVFPLHRRSSCLTEYRTDTTSSVVIPDPDPFSKE